MNKRYIVLIILGVIIIIIGVGGYLYIKNQNNQVKILPPGYNSYWNIKFPFELSSLQINNSLSTGEPVIIKPVESNWPENINNSLLKDGWQLISKERAYDGGSVFYSYYKSKDAPVMKLSYNWDMIKGEYSFLEIKFISSSNQSDLLRKNN